MMIVCGKKSKRTLVESLKNVGVLNTVEQNSMAGKASAMSKGRQPASRLSSSLSFELTTVQLSELHPLLLENDACEDILSFVAYNFNQQCARKSKNTRSNVTTKEAEPLSRWIKFGVFLLVAFACLYSVPPLPDSWARHTFRYFWRWETSSLERLGKIFSFS